MLAGLMISAAESDKWLRLVKATTDEQQETPTLVSIVLVTTVIHLGSVRIVRIHVHYSKVGLNAHPRTMNMVIAIMDVLWVVLHERIPRQSCLSSFVNCLGLRLKNMVQLRRNQDNFGRVDHEEKIVVIYIYRFLWSMS